MPQTLLDETFSREALDPLLKWMNAPSVWRVEPNRLRLLIEPDALTDFWQKTHYGFRVDNGHVLYAEISGDIVVTTGIHCQLAHQYDQAGLMARFSADCWLKASTEFLSDGPSQLGTVVTNNGYSDWSMQSFPYPSLKADAGLYYCLRLRREGPDFIVEHAPSASGPWTMMRIAHLASSPDQPCQIGLYTCSPKEAGCRVWVEFLRMERP